MEVDIASCSTCLVYINQRLSKYYLCSIVREDSLHLVHTLISEDQFINNRREVSGLAEQVLLYRRRERKSIREEETQGAEEYQRGEYMHEKSIDSSY